MKKEHKSKRRRVRRRTIAAMLVIVLEVSTVAVLPEFFEVTRVDARFMRAVKRGLEANWDARYEETQLQETDAPNETAFIKTEYEAVKDYDGIRFRNSELGDVAQMYIEALKQCNDVAEKYDPDKNYEKFWKNFSQPYGQRVEALYYLIKGDYGLDFDGMHQSDIDEILIRGWSLIKSRSIDFKKSDREQVDNKDSDMQSEDNQEEQVLEMTATVTNDSGYDIDFMNVEVALYDAAGKKLETTMAYANDIKKDEEFELRCYQSSEGEVSQYLITAVACEIKNSGAESTDSDKESDN